MKDALAALRVRGADQIAGQVGLIRLRPSRLGSRFQASNHALAFDLPETERVRVHLSSSDAPMADMPVTEIPLTHPGVVGVRFDGKPSSGSFVVHFMGETGNILAREVEPGARHWFDPPASATGLAFSAVVWDRGQLTIDSVDVLLPPTSGPLPRGPYLKEALRVATFPKVPASWPLRFDVKRLGNKHLEVGGIELHLDAVDWDAIDQLDRTEQLLFHGMAMTETVLGESDGASTMATLLKEWSLRYPPRPHSTTYMAWNDMAVSRRTTAILRILDQLRLNSFDGAQKLADLAAGHAEWLAHERNYVSGHDHGMYADTALALTARALAAHPLSERWRALAIQRFADTSATIVDMDEATVREHSPAYVEFVQTLLIERLENGLEQPFESKIDDLESTLRALSTPSGTLIPWGDTALDHASKRTPSVGVHTFPNTGWSISHHSGSMVAMASSFHSRNHKHDDELSFVFFESSGPVIFEAAHPGFANTSGQRSYAESPNAHSGVIFDRPTPDGTAAHPFGGAVAEAAANGDWHALLGWNPRLRDSKHLRLLLHHPEILIVVDITVGTEIGSVTRHFHVAPDIEIELLGDATLRLGERLLSFSPTPEVLELDNSIHFPSQGSVQEHKVVRATTWGPGSVATVLAAHQVAVSGLSKFATHAALDVTIELDDGTSLTIAGSPGSNPRKLELKAVKAPKAHL